MNSIPNDSDIKNTDFFKNTPLYIKKDSLSSIIKDAYRKCSTAQEKDFLESKFNSYKKNPKESEWNGLFCELIFRGWLQELVGPNNNVIFAQKNCNDLKIIAGKNSYNVEVKSIKDNDFEKIKKNTIRAIRNIPTGKIFSIKLKSCTDRALTHFEKNNAYQNDCNELINIIKNGGTSNKWIVKEIGKCKQSNETALIFPPHVSWINYEYLSQTINNSLLKDGKMLKQIANADIICFFFLSQEFDSEDIKHVLKNLPVEFDDKVFGYFTKWQQGRPRFFSKRKLTDKILNTIVKGYPVNQ